MSSNQMLNQKHNFKIVAAIWRTPQDTILDLVTTICPEPKVTLKMTIQDDAHEDMPDMTNEDMPGMTHEDMPGMTFVDKDDNAVDGEKKL